MKSILQKEKHKKRILILKILYMMGLLGMFSLICAIQIGKEKPIQNNALPTYQNITTQWTLDKEGTQPANVKKLGEYMDEKSGVLSIYYLIPELNADINLVYRSKDVSTRILVDGEVLYETSVYDSPFYNKSPGNLWNMLNVSSKYSNKPLELQITMAYNTSAVTADSFYLGDKADIIIGICKENSFGIVISILLMLLGVVLLVIDFLPVSDRAKKHHGLWWVGIYALLNGLWSIIETNVMQFFVDDMRMVQLVGNMLMMLSTVPLVFYIHVELGILHNRLMRILSFLCVSSTLACALVQYSGITDMHAMIIPASIFMVNIDLMMCGWIIIKCMNIKKSGEPYINCLLMTIGVAVRCICSVAETVRTLNSDRLDRAGLIRIGMLILCICFGIGSQIETYKVVEQGLKYDFVSKLAYCDGLTGIGNRTAYLEALEAFKNNSKEHNQLGIIYLDVNNLKKVNDNLGHEYGDKLILTAAQIITDSFGGYGTAYRAYRVGGDEFCVLISSDNAKIEYERAIVVFRQLIEEENKSGKNNYDIQIAHGFSICHDPVDEKLEEAIAKADSAMYQNKAFLKGIA